MRSIRLGMAALLVMGLVSAGTGAMGTTSRPGLGTTGSPEPRSMAGLAMDVDGQLVLFGGLVSSEGRYLNDTWTWDGTAWTKKDPTMAPSPRCCFGIAYDAGRRVLMLVGGCDDTGCLSDTWTWDGTTWAEQSPMHPPDLGPSPGLAYDGARRTVVLSGDTGSFHANTTWTWDGTDWTKHDPVASPSHRTAMGFAYDALRQQTLLFGGDWACFEEECYRPDTWTWNGANWKWLHPDVRPPPRTRMGMAYDRRSDRVVVFGGCCPLGFFGDTWAWNGSTWIPRNPSHSPAPREALTMAWDSVRRQLVLFGGRDAPGGQYRDFGDTWMWDGGDWTCLDACTDGMALAIP